MINPNDISTVSVGQLPDGTFALTNKIAHEIGTELYRGTIQELCVFISNYIGTAEGVGFRAVTVTDGQTLPTTTQQEFILVGKGTYYNVEGGSTLILTEELNAIVSNGTYWFVGVEIPVNVELAGITQFIRSGFISTTPSESTVFDALALKADLTDVEDVANKTSTISGYSETLYPNEKASHDALDLKLNISDLPSNLMLYPTNVASDISGYFKLVTNIHDADYNVTAVDISTPTITGANQLVSSLVTTAGVLIGQPGVFNATTFGNIRRLSGSGTANFYFKVFHRDSTGVETLIGTSSNTEAVTSSSYLEFTSAMLWDDGDFIDTDRIVIKYYANRIAGSSDPVYQFQFGGTSPVRTLLPVPFSVVDAGYELNSNKQNSLAIDGTGTKYPTVDAVNAEMVKLAGNQTISDKKDFEQISIGNPTSDVIGHPSDSFNADLSIKGSSVRIENTTGESLIINTTEYGVGSHFYDANVLSIQNKSTYLGVLSEVPSAIRFLSNTDGEMGAIGYQNGAAGTPFANSMFLAASMPYYPSNPLVAPTRLALIQEGDYLGALLKIERLEFNSDWSTKFKTPNGTPRITIPVEGRVLINNAIDNLTDDLQVNGSLKATTLKGNSLTSNLVLKATTNGQITNSGITDNGTNIGIGNNSSSPAENLEVRTTGNTGFAMTRNAVSNSARFYLKTGTTYNWSIGVRTTRNDYSIFNEVLLSEAFTINTSTNNVLIGTTTDSGIAGDKLQVSGAISTTSTIKAGATVRLKNYTVATLPTGVQGDTAYVTDALAPTYLGALVGGGAVKCPVFYNGTAWVSH